MKQQVDPSPPRAIAGNPWSSSRAIRAKLALIVRASSGTVAHTLSEMPVGSPATHVDNTGAPILSRRPLHA